MSKLLGLIGRKPKSEGGQGVVVRDILDDRGNRIGASILGPGMKEPLIVEDEPSEVEKIARSLVENKEAYTLPSGENKG